MASGPVDGISVASSIDWWVSSGGTLSRFVRAVKTFETAVYGSGFGRFAVRVGSRILSAGGAGVYGFAVAP